MQFQSSRAAAGVSDESGIAMLFPNPSTRGLGLRVQDATGLARIRALPAASCAGQYSDLTGAAS